VPEKKKPFKFGLSRDSLMKIIGSLVKIAAKLEMTGVDNFPYEGAYLIAINHISRLDMPFLMMATKRKDILGMAAKNYREKPFFRWALEKLGVIWIDRDGYDFQAFREASAWLKNGGVIGIAPEGTRSRTGQLLEGKPGAVLLAMKSKVQIIPATITGSADMVKNFLRLKKMQVKIIIGKPFALPEPEEGQIEKDVLDKAITEVMCQIAALLPEERRGFYHNNPRLKELLEEQKTA
jgi:1-acyl-sn-glycerol-3-phosphate acyltransferase